MTKINLLEGIAMGTGIVALGIALNALGSGDSEVLQNNYYLQGLLAVTGAGVLSKLYRRNN